MDSRRKRSAESHSWVVNSSGAKRHAITAELQDLQSTNVNMTSSSSSLPMGNLNIDEFGDMDDDEDDCTSNYLQNTPMFVRTPLSTPTPNSINSSNLLNSLKLEYSHLQTGSRNLNNQLNVRGSFGRLQPTKEDLQDFSCRALRSFSTNIVPSVNPEYSGVSLQNHPLELSSAPVQPPKSLDAVNHQDRILPDGFGALKYPVPNIESFVYDPMMRLRFDPSTGLHYDANARLFYNSVLNIPLYWDALKQTYLHSETRHFADMFASHGVPLAVCAESSMRDDPSGMEMNDRNYSLPRERSRSRSSERHFHRRSRAGSESRITMSRSRSISSCRRRHSRSGQRRSSPDQHAPGRKQSKSTNRNYDQYSRNSMDSVSPGKSSRCYDGRGPVYSCRRSASRDLIPRYRTHSREPDRRNSISKFEKDRRNISNDRRADHFIKSCLDGVGHRRSSSRSYEQPHTSYNVASRVRSGVRRSRSRKSNHSSSGNDSFRKRRRYSRSRSASVVAREIAPEKGGGSGRESRRCESRPSRSPLRRNDQMARHRLSDRREYSDVTHCQRKVPKSEERRHKGRRHVRSTKDNDDSARRNKRERSGNDESSCSQLEKNPKISDRAENRSSGKKSVESGSVKSEPELSTKNRSCGNKMDDSVQTDRLSDQPSKPLELADSKSLRSRQRLSKSPVNTTKPTRENIDSRSRQSKWEKDKGSREKSGASKSPRRNVPSVSTHSVKQKIKDHHDRKEKESCHQSTAVKLTGDGNRSKKVSDFDKPVSIKLPENNVSASIALSESLLQSDSKPSTDILTSPCKPLSGNLETDDARNIILRKRQTRRSLLETEESKNDSCSSLFVKVTIDTPDSEQLKKRDKFRIEKNEQIGLVQFENEVTSESIIPPEELSLTIDSLLFNELRKAEKNSSSEVSDQSSLVPKTAQDVNISNPDNGQAQESRVGVQPVSAQDVNSPNVDVKTFQLPSTEDPGMLESFIVIDDELDFSGDEVEYTDKKSLKGINDVGSSTITQEKTSDAYEQKLLNENALPSDESSRVDIDLVVEEKPSADMADGEWCILDEVDDSNENANVSQQLPDQGSPQNGTHAPQQYDPPTQNANEEFSDVSSTVDVSNENDEKVSIINSISDYDDEDVFANEQALSNVSSNCDEPNDNADALSSISSVPEGFGNKDEERTDEIQSHTDAFPEEEEKEDNAEDDLIGDLLKEEENEEQPQCSIHVLEESLFTKINTLDTDSIYPPSSPAIIVDCVNHSSTEENLTKVEILGSRDIGDQSVDTAIQDEPMFENSRASCEKSNALVNPCEPVLEKSKSPICEQSNALANPCELVSEEPESPACEQSNDDVVTQPVFEKVEEPQIEKEHAEKSTILEEVGEHTTEEPSHGAANSDCELLGELSDDEVELIGVPNDGSTIIELSDDERIENPDVSGYTALNLPTLDDFNQWLHGGLSSIEKVPIPESFQPVDSAESVKKWSGIQLQISNRLSVIKPLKPDTHVTAKFFSQRPTNFILARTDMLPPDVLARALVDTLRKRSVRFLGVRKNSTTDSGAPYNYCHVIFQTAEAAEKWYNSCKGLVPLFGIAGRTIPAMLSFSTGNWICPTCKKCNFTLRYFCFQCYSCKDGRQSSPIRLVETPSRILGIIFTDLTIQVRNLFEVFPKLLSFMPVTAPLPVIDPVTKLPTGLNALEFQTTSECADAFHYLSGNKPRNLKIIIAYVELTNVLTRVNSVITEKTSYVDLTNECSGIPSTSNVGRPIPTVSASSSKLTDKAKKQAKPQQGKPLMRPRKPDGNPEYKYPPPRYATFRIEPLTGLYFDFQTGLYYHKSTDYFFNDDLCIYLKYDSRQKTYVKVNVLST